MESAGHWLKPPQTGSFAEQGLSCGSRIDVAISENVKQLIDVAIEPPRATLPK
jgi:hypothetical protein|tara:strand:+ start:279 stop:437 length:159 start_codon:yes stop_codon:yes gene_type:complete